MKRSHQVFVGRRPLELSFSASECLPYPRMSRLFHRMLLWGDFLEILSFLSIDDVYRCCGRLNRSGFIAFLRERATRQCPKESANRSRFLSRGLNHQKVLLVSYPRSGNSFLRRLLESSLGIVTGSDSRPNRTLSESLLRCGFKGAGYSYLYCIHQQLTQDTRSK